MIRIQKFKIPYYLYSNKRISTKKIENQLKLVEELKNLHYQVLYFDLNFEKAQEIRRKIKKEKERLSQLIDERLKKFKPRKLYVHQFKTKINYDKELKEFLDEIAKTG